MNELSDRKRKLPRHVDGRIMIGLMPLKNFSAMLPIAAAIIVLVIKYFSPVIFFIGVLLLGITIGMFSEFHQRETGFTILKDIIKYTLAKEMYFERNIGNVSFSKRFTRFEARQEKRGQE
jgi:hypothetical protein